MKKQVWFSGAAVIAMITAAVMFGCSGKDDKGAVPADRELISQAVAGDNQLPPRPPEPVGKKVAITDSSAAAYPINDLLPVGKIVYAACDGALIIRNLKEKANSAVIVPDHLRAVVSHDGQIFTGGEKLYQLVDDQLVPTLDQPESPINVMYSFGDVLMVGTDCGLYSRTLVGLVKVNDSLPVSALVADSDALWIGTDGDGLYRWDGTSFQKRFLVRDESLFNDVTALAYNHNHLYLGTDQGLFIYDGGRWEPFDSTNGLPSNVVTSIDASDWTVYIGTDKGLMSYYDRVFSAVEGFQGQQIVEARKLGRKLVVATQDQGLFVKVGDKVTALVTVPKDELQVAVTADTPASGQ